MSEAFVVGCLSAMSLISASYLAANSDKLGAFSMTTVGFSLAVLCGTML